MRGDLAETDVTRDASDIAGGADGDSATWCHELRRLRVESGAQMAFGGSINGHALELRQFEAARTAALSGVSVVRGAGLGGRVWAERSVLAVHDYRVASDITHHYDRAVLAEGLRGVAAAPVVVDGTVRAVIYAGVREGPGAGDRLRDATAAAAARIGARLALNHEVDRRVAMLLAARENREAAATERLRTVYAELVAVRRETTDLTTRSRLDALLPTLAAVRPAQAGGLSEGQRSVLVLVATGASYPEVADQLGLRPSTVKTYMRDILARLGVHSRHAAVVEARRRGLIG